MHSMLSMISAEAVVSERAHRARRHRPAPPPIVAADVTKAPAAPRPGRRRRLWHLRARSTEGC